VLHSRTPEAKNLDATSLQASLSLLPQEAVTEVLQDKVVQTNVERLEK
jgi:hypothetical protein